MKILARPLPPQSGRPFRLLLYLEWLLIGMALVSTVMPDPLRPSAGFSALEVFRTVVLGLMGLQLPSRPLSKFFYTLLEFSLLLLPFLFNAQNRAMPLLGVIIVIRSSQMFGLLGQSIVVCLTFASFLLMILPEGGVADQLQKAIQNAEASKLFTSSNTLLLKFHAGLSFGMLLIAVMLLVNSLLAERQNRKDLATAHKQLQQYAARIGDQATLQERNRIAREIHDALGHTLTAQSIQLENALLFCPAEAEKTQMFLAQSKQLCSKALQEVRQSVATLRSPSLKAQTLKQAITAVIHEFEQNSAVQLDYSVDLDAAIPTEVSIVVCRIVQEALVNVHKHSSASWVKVRIQATNQELLIAVIDNGCGFDPSLNQTGFGLQGIRERATALGGRLTLVSQPSRGCHVTVSIPLSGQIG